MLTDLIENFEPRKLGPMMRFLTWIGGVQDPDGQMPRDLRLTSSRHKAEMRKAAETMIAWQPERIIIAHGALVRERRHRRASPRVPMDIR